MNTYLFKIFSYRLLEEEIDKIIKDNESIINFNYDEVSINDIIDECAYYSLLDEGKVVIVKNFKLNSSSKDLEKYLENPNEITKLILVVDNIDKRNSIYKTIKEKGHIIEIDELKVDELRTKIQSYIKKKNLSIDYNSINKLMEMNVYNYDLILNEIDKLSIISKDITEELVSNYGSIIESEDTFGLCDAITGKKYKIVLELMDRFSHEKKEVIPFISLLANQYRIIYATKVLSGTNEYIAKELSIHPFRVKLAREKSILYTNQELEDNILGLCDLDLKLKSVNADPYVLLKDFIIKAI